MDAKMDRLGAKLFGNKDFDVRESLREAEKLIPSARFHEILSHFGGAIVFDNGAKYKPRSRTPMTKPDGCNNLEILYGLGSGPDSLLNAWSKYEDQLPASIRPIGEAPGGNLICVTDKGTIVLWDHESEPGEGIWEVAASLDEFLDELEPDDDAIGSTDGIIESESHLDF